MIYGPGLSLATQVVAKVLDWGAYFIIGGRMKQIRAR